MVLVVDWSSLTERPPALNEYTHLGFLNPLTLTAPCALSATPYERSSLHDDVMLGALTVCIWSRGSLNKRTVENTSGTVPMTGREIGTSVRSPSLSVTVCVLGVPVPTSMLI